MSLACALYALLASQALAAYVVRNEAVNKHSEKVAVAAPDVLFEVEQLAQARVAPQKPKIQKIQELAKELEDALKATHKTAQDEVTANLAAIKKCNDHQVNQTDDINDGTKKEKEKKRKDHADCREEEKTVHETKETTCTVFKKFLKQSVSVAPEMEGSEDDEMVDYIGKMDAYWCPKRKIAKDKEKKCTTTTKEWENKTTTCNDLQSKFELSFCTELTEKEDVCKELNDCYAKKLKIYEDHKAATEKLVQQWKTEYTALKKISCYVNVWLSDQDASTVDAEELENCKKLRPDTSVMDINFGEPVEKATCSLEDVKVHPGSPDFSSAEYGEFAEFVKKPAKCLEEASTEAPTAAPTEPPAQPPYEAPTEAPY